MFYSTTVLTKRGPLAKVWLAAHVHTKLTKAMALSTNVSAAVGRIIAPEAPMALRLTSQLLLGVARIYSRKAKYLLADSSEALARLKIAYTPASSNDLPDAHANPAAITLADADADAGAADPVGASTASRRRDRGPAVALDMPDMPDMEFPESLSPAGPSPRYLADAKDITIDDYSGGAGIAAFGRDPDLDFLPVDDVEQNRFALSYDDMEEEQPLMFTPSQQRSAPSTPRRRSSALAGEDAGSVAESVEKMRDASMPGDDGVPGTPRLSFAPSTPGASPKPDGAASPGPAELEKDDTPVPLMPGGDGGRDSLGGFTPGGPEGDKAAGDEPQLMLPDQPAPDFAEDAAAGEAASEAAATEATANADEAPTATGEALKSGEQEEAMNDEEAKAASGGSGDSGGEEGEAEVQKRPRKRRVTAALWDEETELPASYVRSCLNDTSDILRPHKRTRVTLEAQRLLDAERGLTARDILARPVFPLLAPELSALFASCIDADVLFKVPGSPVTASGRVSRQRAAARELDSDGEVIESSDADKAADKAADADADAGADADADADADAVAAHREDAIVPVSPIEDTGEAEVQPGDGPLLQSAKNSGSGQDAEHGNGGGDGGEDEEGRASMSQPRFSMGGASSIGDMPMPSMDDELPLPVPGEEMELPLPDARSPAPAGSPRDDAMGDKLTFAEVALTQVAVKNADAEADNELGDARMTKRALKMRDLLAERISPDTGRVAFSKVLGEEAGVTRRVAARSFYELLNLCSRRVVALEQETAYGDIRVVPVQPAFDSLVSDDAQATAAAAAADDAVVAAS